LFAGGTYDRDDDEADRIYQEVDEKMDRRRKIRRLVSHFPNSPILPRKADRLSYIISLDELVTDVLPTGKHERKQNERNTSAIIPRSNNNSQT